MHIRRPRNEYVRTLGPVSPMPRKRASRKPRKSKMERTLAWLRTTRRRVFAHAALKIVLAGAAYTSFRHIYHVAHEHGADMIAAGLAPLTVDGTMIVAARYLMHAKSKAARAVAGFTFSLGVGATCGANWLAGEPDPVGRAVAVGPAVALVLVALIIHVANRKPVTKPRQKPATQTAEKPARQTAEKSTRSTDRSRATGQTVPATA